MTKDIKVLVLSCGTGGGHNMAALAVQEGLRDNGIYADFIEYLEITNKKIKDKVNKLYINSTKLNGKIFKRIYRLGELYSKTKIKSPVYALNKLSKKSLYKYIVDNGYNFIVTTHLFAAQALTEIKKKHDIHFVAIATDYVCIPFWQEVNPDFFIIPNEDLIKDFTDKGIPKEKLLPYGIPVSKEYNKHIEKNVAKEILNLDKTKKYILVLTGSMGFGKGIEITRKLLQEIKDAVFIISCGNNEKMLEKSKQEFKNEKRVIILPHTNKLSTYIKISEIVLTKPRRTYLNRNCS